MEGGAAQVDASMLSSSASLCPMGVVGQKTSDFAEGRANSGVKASHGLALQVGRCHAHAVGNFAGPSAVTHQAQGNLWVLEGPEFGQESACGLDFFRAISFAGALVSDGGPQDKIPI